MSGKSIVSDISVGTSFELTKTLAHAVSKAGGTKAHLLYLLNDKTIAAEIADMLVIGAFGPKTYPMPRLQGFSFSMADVRSAYRVTPAFDQQVTMPAWGSVSGATAAKLMRIRMNRRFARNHPYVPILREEMERHGFRPATLYDLLAWGSEYTPRPAERVFAIGRTDDEENPFGCPYIEKQQQDRVLGLASPTVSNIQGRVSLLAVI